MAEEKKTTETAEDEKQEGSAKKTLMTFGLVGVIFVLLFLFYFWKIGAVDFIYKGY